MDIVRRDQFLGINNRAKPERLPEGAVADAVNVDFTVGGKAELRTGYTKLRGGDIRALLSFRGSPVIVDGNDLIIYGQGTEQKIANIGDGDLSAVEHGGKLYLNTQADSLVIGDTVEPWAIQQPSFNVSAIQGTLHKGVYKVAVTSVSGGVESGTVPAVISLEDGSGIQVSAPAGSYRVYCSQTDGQTLYYQREMSKHASITSVVDDDARLETAGLTRLPFCKHLASHGGYILGAHGKLVLHTEPMHPHLYDPVKNYIPFPSEVNMIAPVAGGFFVSSDKTYFVSGLGAEEFNLHTVLEFPAITGTLVTLPGSMAAWFTEYGQVIAAGDGSIQSISGDQHSPDIGSQGASGLLNHNGNQMIVTTMRGNQSNNRLRSSDQWEIEIA